jgi:hypothetical protein
METKYDVEVEVESFLVLDVVLPKEQVLPHNEIVLDVVQT